MKLVTFINTQGKERIGIRIASTPREAHPQIIDVCAADPSLPPQLDMLGLIQDQDKLMPKLRQLETQAREGKLTGPSVQPESWVKLLSPIPRPVSMRDGYAFRQHVEAARRNRGVPMIPEFDHFPVFYFTNHLAVTGPGEVPVQKLAQEKLDFELEVAIVVGKKGRNIPASKADEYIFGYCVMNDWSARALQMEEMKLNLGPAKGKDFATSLGPYLVTRDELSKFAVPSPQGERHDLRMRAFVNGKQLSDGNVKDMSWTFAQILERASYGVTMHPGEVIGSGTVGTGCLLELNGSKITDNLWLKPGDQVVMEVEELGRLENKVIEGRESQS
jgi:fumarylacetoacetate (FAA) hydrolase